MEEQKRDGLEWEDGLFELKPRWTREPQPDAIARVCRTALEMAPEDDCAITFHAEGAFNKVYRVESSRGKFMMRVSLPIDPKHKTRGEVTTLRWIRRHTQMPVPKVLDFDDSQNNEIGFEWILMEFMPGTSAYKRWRKMAMADKTWLVEQVAEFQSQIFHHSFESIGTLSIPGNSDKPTDSEPGRIVEIAFFYGDNFNYDVPRGPFRSSHDWLSAYLALVHREHTKALEEGKEDEEEDENDREHSEVAVRVAARLLALLPKIFPALQSPAEQTVLWHDDFSLANILVDDDGKLTAVLDWECVSAKPLWVASGMPKFLFGGRIRETEPQRESYGDASEERVVDDGLDNEGKNRMYWDHMMEYEETQLRKVYAAKMKELWPQWETENKYRSLKADFMAAVDRCASGWFFKPIEKWVDALERGAMPRLNEILQPELLSLGEVGLDAA